MNAKYKTLTVLLFGSAVIWASCTKNQPANSAQSDQNTVTVTESSANADQTFDEVTNSVLTASVNGQALGAMSDSTSGFSNAAIVAKRNGGLTVDGPGGGGSVTVTLTPDTPGVFPKTLTINFGSGFTALNGTTFAGSVTTVFTNPLSEPGASATTTFSSFYIDSIGISGTHILTNNSTNDSITFGVQVENASISFPSGFTLTRNSNRSFTMIAGASTPFWPFDDVWDITGTGAGSTSTNFSWADTIETPLQAAYICPWFESGTVKVVSSAGTGLLNFGNGNCDDQATVTVGDSTFSITLNR